MEKNKLPTSIFQGKISCKRKMSFLFVNWFSPHLISSCLKTPHLSSHLLVKRNLLGGGESARQKQRGPTMSPFMKVLECLSYLLIWYTGLLKTVGWSGFFVHSQPYHFNQRCSSKQKKSECVCVCGKMSDSSMWGDLYYCKAKCPL